jgi:hypothetical protein
MKLTTHLRLVPRSKNEWSYTSTPPICLHGGQLYIYLYSQIFELCQIIKGFIINQ